MKENQREAATCRQIFARAAKEHDGRFASSSNEKENPLAIAEETSKGIGISSHEAK